MKMKREGTLIYYARAMKKVPWIHTHHTQRYPRAVTLPTTAYSLYSPPVV
jgi:hypothetical protein